MEQMTISFFKNNFTKQNRRSRETCDSEKILSRTIGKVCLNVTLDWIVTFHASQ